MVVVVCVNGAVVVDGVEVVGNNLHVPVEGIHEVVVVAGLRVLVPNGGLVTKSKWIVLLECYHLKCICICICICMYMYIYIYIYIYIYNTVFI